MDKIYKSLILALIALALILIFIYLDSADDQVSETEEDAHEDVADEDVIDDRSYFDEDTTSYPDVEVLAEDLVIPWEVVFLPNTTEVLITERPGNLLHIDLDSGERSVVASFDDVEHTGEAGLLGMALHPNFNNNGWIYLYMTSSNDSQEGLINRVDRFTWNDGNISDRQNIISNIPGSRFHDGGRISFGPDGHLYITTGDASDVSLPQDTSSLAGKILRINDDGSIPEDNPFGNEVYSFGHRNPQGITWDNNGRLWSTEHGPTARDELNLIEKGGNYGWPDSVGDVVQEDTVGPVIHSGLNNTWAPSGITYYNNRLFFVGLRGSAVYEVVFTSDDDIDLNEYFKDEFSRIRTIVLGPDDMFYIVTNNRDGRGSVREGDDKLIRLNPSKFGI